MYILFRWHTFVREKGIFKFFLVAEHLYKEFWLSSSSELVERQHKPGGEYTASQHSPKTTAGNGRKSAAAKPTPASHRPSAAASAEPEQGSEDEENLGGEDEDNEEDEEDEKHDEYEEEEEEEEEHDDEEEDDEDAGDEDEDEESSASDCVDRYCRADAVNTTISKTATRPWTPRSGEACRKCLQRLIAKFKTREAESLQKTGTNEEVTEFMHVLGELSALSDGEVVASSRKVKTKQGLEAQSGAEMREAAMKGLVKSVFAIYRRWTERLFENVKVNVAPTPSANATNKRRRNNLGALHDVLNTRLEQDEADLKAARKEDEVRHNAHIEALKVMTETLANVNEGLRSMHDEQQKTNALLEAQELHRREEQIRRREQELGGRWLSHAAH
ncbi:hypothetical protein R3P38DRAFT_2800329 [Favolaschia claudopus]|uniref:Uncharacterized protein n=1 Tax=Favolaschia claudopus TaxID=2862362 RepID=A0AAV9ZXL1_9AGAR